MDVYLIPTITSEPYEIYYEAPDEEVVDLAEAAGFIQGRLHRIKVWFSDALKEAEEWRHRRHEAQPEPAGVMARARRKVLGFIVERIAEQRLLWHLRTAEAVCARIPSDIPDAEAERIVRQILKKDTDHHLKWLLIDLALLVVSLPLVVIPGPNVPGLYFAFQVVGHFLSWRGAKWGQTLAWTFKPSQDLADLRQAMTMPPPERLRIFRELAARLRLEHLETYLKEVAAPSA